jgi:hypothetical protein
MQPYRKAKAIAIRTHFARKVLLTFALVLGTYLALLPVLHRLAE